MATEGRLWTASRYCATSALLNGGAFHADLPAEASLRGKAAFGCSSPNHWNLAVRFASKPGTCAGVALVPLPIPRWYPARRQVAWEHRTYPRDAP